MKKKILIPAVLIAVAVVLGLAQGICLGAGQALPSQPGSAGQEQSPGRDNIINVYYFHGKARCYSCTLIEKLTRQGVEEGFPQELADGRVRFAALNVEQDENKHFIKDYKLYTKSVIVSDVIEGKEGRWKNLQKVWELLRDEEAFKDYVQDEVRQYLKGE